MARSITIRDALVNTLRVSSASHFVNNGYVATFKDNLRRLRSAADLSQEALAHLCGRSGQSWIGNFEAGKREPSFDDLAKLASALGVSQNELLGKSPLPHVRRDDWADVRGFAQAAGLGNGAEANEYAEAHSLKFKASSLSRKRLQPDKLAVFYGKGDSMLPRIRPGDAILFDTSDTRPVDGAIFLIMWRGEYYAKRAMALDDIVYFVTDNATADHNWNKPKRMDSKRDPIEIIGRVRWIGSWED